MLALKCEICGGKLTAKSGGIFECEYCGLQYDKTRVQEMVQEIKGTVKVEGTVDVKGTVKIDGPVSIESSDSKNALLNRARRHFEAHNYLECYKSIFKILDIDPKCSEAHIIAFCCTVDCKSLDELPENVVDFDFESIRFKNAIKYGNSEQVNKLENWKVRIENNKNNDLANIETMKQILDKRREEIEPFYNITNSLRKLLFISPKGKICSLGEENSYPISKLKTDELNKLKYVKKISILVGHDNVVVLDLFGNVYCLLGKTKYIKKDIIIDGSAINIVANGDEIYILRKGGSLIGIEISESRISYDEFWVSTDKPFVEFNDIEKLIKYDRYISCPLAIDKNGKIIKLSKYGCETLPDDYNFSFYNSCIKNDGTHKNYETISIDEEKKRWRNVVDYIEKTGEKSRNKNGSVVDRKSAYVLLADGTIDYCTYGFHLDSTTEKLDCCKVARIFNYYNKGIYAITDDGKFLTIEDTRIVSEEKLFNNISEYEDDRVKFIDKAIIEYKSLLEEKTNLENDLLSFESKKSLLHKEINNLSGFFTGGRKRELQSQIDSLSRSIDVTKDRIKNIDIDIYKEQ